ncbi:hypothetical protein HELRODRAFT_189224 [Helobdella robusta]|uniref:Sialate O-acetylesterase domain-containing protein n=1 Tax=Helobdella robusta TaxID=6412 RepID=T1FQT7_HELRO|nr:hypothetical protein HELRODRAFT_189224 [Helobdella robusta]ESN96386.1 hypothetical protein HELRODRAFT_189224 [Helobdella robusta]
MGQESVFAENVKENGDSAATMESSQLIMQQKKGSGNSSAENLSSSHGNKTRDSDQKQHDIIEMSLMNGNGENQTEEDKEKIVVLDGGDNAGDGGGAENSTKVGFLKMKRCDVRYLFIALIVLIILIGIASIAFLARRFETKAYEDLKFAGHFSDHMVLQRAPHKSIVWGYVTLPSNDLTVEVKLQGHKVEEVYKAHVERFVSGATWSVTLKEHDETTPFQLSAYVVHADGSLNSDNNVDEGSYLYNVTLRDVLFGYVWICAGDQLMEESQDSEADEKVDAGSNITPDVRLFSLHPFRSDILWSNVRNVKHHWTIPSKDTISNTSATCWLFGQKLARHLKYPIGLVLATFPDSLIQDWAPPSSNKCEQGRDSGVEGESSGSKIWNAMLHPLTEFSTYGVVWFHGVQDASKDSANYSCPLIHMINTWRNHEHAKNLKPQGFVKPFAIVQIPPSQQSSNSSFSRVDIRWKQTMNHGYLPNSILPGAFLVPTIDLVGSHLDYNELSERLLSGALSHAYSSSNDNVGERGEGRSYMYDNQLPINYVFPKNVRENPLVISLKNTVTVHDTQGFEVCCSKDNSTCSSLYMKVPFAPGREWVDAPIIPSVAHIPTRDIQLNVAMNCAHKITGLRYLWREAPCRKVQNGSIKCPIHFSDSSLPLLPFIRFSFDSKHLLDPDLIRRPIMSSWSIC